MVNHLGFATKQSLIHYSNPTSSLLSVNWCMECTLPGYISEKLHVLANRITTDGKLNMLGLHIHSENFYLYLFNLLYDYNLENLNKSLQNVEAIDLVDHTNRIVIQVSSTSTKKK